MSGVTVSPDPFTNPPVLVRTQLSRLPFVTLPVSIGTSHPVIVSLYSGLMGIFGSTSSLAAAEITGTAPGLLVGSPAHLRHIVHAGCSRFGSIVTLLVAPSAMTPAAAAAPTGLTTLLGELCWSLPWPWPLARSVLPSRESPMVSRSDWSSPSTGVKESSSCASARVQAVTNSGAAMAERPSRQRKRRRFRGFRLRLMPQA